MGRQVGQFGLEVRIVLDLVPVPLEVEDQRHQRLGDKAAAENAEHGLLVGSGAEGIGCGRLVHRRSLLDLVSMSLSESRIPLLRDMLWFEKTVQAARSSRAALTARKNCSISAGSLTPGALSTPDE